VKAITDPRAITPDEITGLLIADIALVARHWSEVDSDAVSMDDRCNGLAHSILVLLDGCAGYANSPAFDLIARPDEGAKQDSIMDGENWIEDGTVISGGLHERFSRYTR